ncbi:hypothetical protein TNCV_607051 [Trichonephila clavipes]|nr:hypothetical protein TNCV_607051 [Trichonephila clavipes]
MATPPISTSTILAWNGRGGKYSPVPCTRDSDHKTFRPTDLTSTYSVCTWTVFGGIRRRTQAFRNNGVIHKTKKQPREIDIEKSLSFPLSAVRVVDIFTQKSTIGRKGEKKSSSHETFRKSCVTVSLPRRQEIVRMDGTPPHIAKPFQKLLQFWCGLIENAWPSRSPYLNPCDFLSVRTSERYGL